jgi:hypothetical protein
MSISYTQSNETPDGIMCHNVSQCFICDTVPRKSLIFIKLCYFYSITLYIVLLSIAKLKLTQMITQNFIVNIFLIKN